MRDLTNFHAKTTLRKLVKICEILKISMLRQFAKTSENMRDLKNFNAKTTLRKLVKICEILKISMLRQLCEN